MQSDGRAALRALIREAVTPERTATFLGVRCSLKPPTRAHRPALWENMLGTVYAMNDAGEVKYFDYKHREAVAFSGAAEPNRDPRLARAKHETQDGPRRRQLCVYVLRPPKTPEQEEAREWKKKMARFRREWQPGL